MDVCDVCEADIFGILSNYTNKFPKKFIAILPLNTYLTFVNYNKEYNLNIKTILPFKGDLIDFSPNYRRAIFFTLNHKFRIQDIYVPSKPVLEKELMDYLLKITSKI